jgi:hypothetical protein
MARLSSARNRSPAASPQHVPAHSSKTDHSEFHKWLPLSKTLDTDFHGSPRMQPVKIRALLSHQLCVGISFELPLAVDQKDRQG